MATTDDSTRALVRLCLSLAALGFAAAVRLATPAGTPDVPMPLAMPRYASVPNTLVGVTTGEPVVALTTDDGPDPRYTPQMTAMLERTGSRATFFMVGAHVAESPHIARSVAAAGHEVANHTWSHTDLRQRPHGDVADELTRTSAELRLAGVRDAPLFRAPRGQWGGSWKTAQGLGYRCVGWTLTLEKHLRGRTVADAVGSLLAQVRPGSIIVVHDGRLDRSRTMAALPLLLEGLRRDGFRVVTVGELLRLTRMPPRAPSR